MQIERIWNEILTNLQTNVGEKSLSTWFDNVRLKAIGNGKIVIETPNRFVSDWIARNYKREIEKAAASVVGGAHKLSFELSREMAAAEPAAEDREKTAKAAPQPETDIEVLANGLNPNLTFENFVVGGSNQFAHAACMAVAQKKSRNYNPLFIYGGVGLGKTHLLNAVGNEMLRRKPKLRVVCIQAESFLNEMIHAIRSEKMDSFRSRFRKDCDLLLMDDIEILAGKERTQEEFFYTFNDLYTAGKKIVMTSDKFPKEMTTLEERLRSRFESGIIVDIQPPEFETRLAIIKHKVEKDGIDLPDSVAKFLAERIKSNIRKLEGCLIRLSAVSSLSGSPITIELADQVMSAILDDVGVTLSAEHVMKSVASYFKIKVSDLKSPKRNRKYAAPRQMAMYICREMCGMSFPEIGQAFGGRDHSTVIHSCRKIGIEKNVDPELGRHLDVLMSRIKKCDAR